MSEILLRHYQKEATDAVQKALNNGRKHNTIEGVKSPDNLYCF